MGPMQGETGWYPARFLSWPAYGFKSFLGAQRLGGVWVAPACHAGQVFVPARCQQHQAGDPHARRFENFQRKQRKHAKCKYNIVCDPFAHYFPSVSSLNTAPCCLGQRGAYGSEPLLQLRSELRAEPLAALLRGWGALTMVRGARWVTGSLRSAFPRSKILPAVRRHTGCADC